MAEIILLNRIRVDIGNVSGSLSELMQYAGMAGFNDNYEPQTKPRLVGTWIITDWYTSAQLQEAQSIFDGITIVEDPNYVIDFSRMAVQVLDDTQPNYNPAIAIKLQSNNIGNTIPQPLISGKGKWFIYKNQAASLTTIPTCNFRTIIDSNGIVSNDTTVAYTFTSFNEFVYFTGITTLPNGMFNGAWSCPFFKLPNGIVTTTWCWQGWDNNATCVAEIPSSIQNYSALFGYNPNNGTTSCAYRLHFNHLVPPTLNNVIHQAANNIIFYVGNGESKINDSKALELFKNANYWKQYNLRSWYDFAAPKVVYDGSNVTITVENTSTIYYTTDGSTPSENSTQYSAPFAWDGQGVIKAIAIDNYDRRTQAEPFYVQTVSNPTVTIDTTTKRITLSSTTSESVIYYTLDGSHPTLDSSIYSGPIDATELGDIVKVRCFAVKDGMNDSEVVGKIYVMDDSLWGTDGDTSSFAVQCMDSTKPNYNPAVCIILDNKEKLTDKCYGSGGYITKTDAAAITNFGTARPYWFSNKVNVLDEKKLIDGTSFEFTSFNELKYFTSKKVLLDGYNASNVGEFGGCTKLQSISLKNITDIKAFAFYNCPSLINIAFEPNQITNIGNSAFAKCTLLPSINIQDTLITTTNSGVFTGCTSLTALVYSSTLTTISSSAFYNGPSVFFDFSRCTITSISNDAFFDNYGSIRFSQQTVPTISNPSSTWYRERISKIYIGDGNSQSDDETMLALFANNTGFAPVVSKLDTWYNYLHPQI